MVLETVLSSPHRRSSSFKRQFSKDELGSWSSLVERHRFLLTALVLLAFLCTVYLYFAVTLGATGTCSGLTGNQKALCQAKASVGKGKMKFF
ncbi:Ephrin-A3 [Melia azedarach]|uniref:Ephrin-A3 n=1 Tax=Melia azedarach TaxID=155640 RepID=A0ACC1Y4L5_MELAZ|nr:Ephrin-A3 [Melia azedarach]